MLKVILFCNDATEFARQKAKFSSGTFVNAEVVFGDSTLKSREQLINENQNSWLLFLDHDCFPTEEARLEIIKVTAISKESRAVVFAGPYENPHYASLLQRTHNFIANTWLEQSYSGRATEPVLLGGNFLIYACLPVELPAQKFWGAEDKLLAKHLQNAGYSMQYRQELKAVHETSKSFRHFVRRAVLHGRHDAVYFENESGTKISYWIRKTDFSDLRLMPLILLHFCIQKAAKAAQKLLRKSKQ